NTSFRRTDGTQYWQYEDIDMETGDIKTKTKEYKYSYVDIEPSSGSANPIVGFDVDDNLSGVYDIYLVTCPIWLLNPISGTIDGETIASMDTRPYRFYTNIFERDDKGEYPNSGVRLKNPNIDAVDVDGKPVYGTNYFVTHGGSIFRDPLDHSELAVNDTLYIGEYEFKNAYYGRNENGVIIQLQVQITSKQTKDYSRRMLISSIILKPRGYKDESGEIVLFPHAYQAPAADPEETDEPAASAVRNMRIKSVINKIEK
ncbi:MAG: hypothetical protein Q4P12_05490, partial [Bacteroidales bacterium]|nr:hypothetical protein [Bacteroidales bacterium]